MKTIYFIDLQCYIRPGRQTREERLSQRSCLMEKISDEQKAAGMRAGPEGPGWMVALPSWPSEQVRMISGHVPVRLSIPVS